MQKKRNVSIDVFKVFYRSHLLLYLQSTIGALYIENQSELKTEISDFKLFEKVDSSMNLVSGELKLVYPLSYFRTYCYCVSKKIKESLG
jgi:hypothetical protein